MTTGHPTGPWKFAFICVHAGRQGQPILHVSREAPVDPQDSGWCFSCGQAGHADEDWLLVRADRYFTADPSLAPLLEMPEGHCADRQQPGREWEIEELPRDAS
jgi:hypothetical protein